MKIFLIFLMMISMGSIADARKPEQITAGGEHTCVLYDDGVVKCFGFNFLGQLGMGSNTNWGNQAGQMGAALPSVDLGTGRRPTKIVAGEFFNCALFIDHTVKCWGANTFGQLGLGDTSNRGQFPGQMGDALPMVALGTGKKAIDITAGTDHACVLLAGGEVKCWGRNNDGQLGTGDTRTRGAKSNEMGDALPVVELGSGKTAISIAAGESQTCAVLKDHTLKCWGDNFFGQLGLEDKLDRTTVDELGDALPIVRLGADRHVESAVSGYYHSCALLAGGAVKCWGDPNRTGVLGYGDSEIRGATPQTMGDHLPEVILEPGLHATELSCTRDEVSPRCCAILSNGALKCWGKNSTRFGASINLGLLGFEEVEDRGDKPDQMGIHLPFVDLGRFTKAKQIAMGSRHTCVLMEDGRVKCWGSNGKGQIGAEAKSHLGVKEYESEGWPGMGDALPYVAL